MRLEDLAAETRPRSHWEAVDLGFALVRRHFPKLLAAWLLCIGPIWAALLVLSHWLPIGLILFFIWWLKPVYDRVPLFYLSRALFGATPTLRETLRAWPRLLVSRLPSALLRDRLSSTRCLLLPVQMLEGLKGGARRERGKVLARHSGSTASSLMFCCAGYEAVLVFGLVLLLWMFLPETATYEISESFLDVGFRRGDLPPPVLWLGIGCWLTAVTLVEIFFTGGSFGLYLNSRTHLEGWDVELAFRKLGGRLAAVAAAIALLLSLPASAAVKIATQRDTERQKKAAQEEISTVLASEDFKIHKIKIRKPKAEDISTSDFGFGRFFEVIGYILFWAAIAFALWKLIEFIIRNRHSLVRRPGAAANAPAAARTLMGLDVAPESLPEDIVRAARERFGAGDFHGALSLLYRGALSWLVNRAELPVQDSDTEGDCLRHARKLPDPQRRDYFDSLTVQWIAAAYADRAPRTDTMNALLDHWPFDTRRSAP